MFKLNLKSLFAIVPFDIVRKNVHIGDFFTHLVIPDNPSAVPWSRASFCLSLGNSYLVCIDCWHGSNSHTTLTGAAAHQNWIWRTAEIVLMTTWATHLLAVAGVADWTLILVCWVCPTGFQAHLPLKGSDLRSQSPFPDAKASHGLCGWRTD